MDVFSTSGNILKHFSLWSDQSSAGQIPKKVDMKLDNGWHLIDLDGAFCWANNILQIMAKTWRSQRMGKVSHILPLVDRVVAVVVLFVVVVGFLVVVVALPIMASTEAVKFVLGSTVYWF